MKQYIMRAAGFFFVLCAVFIPFAFPGLQRKVTSLLFSWAVRTIGRLITGEEILVDFSSDTWSMLLLMALLLLVGCLLAGFVKPPRKGGGLLH